MSARARRIFQIGFNRCGTTSLYRFFRDNGVPAIHWDHGQIARSYLRRREAGEDPFADYPHIVFFSDMGDVPDGGPIEPYKDFRYILQFHPDAYFILNVRPVPHWITSRANHGKLIRSYRDALGLRTPAEVFRHWEADWNAHTGDVQTFFADRPGQLIVFDIEKDDPQRLVNFFEPDFALDAAHYQRANKAIRNRYSLVDGLVLKTPAAERWSR